jgi:hypothetical protein
MSSARSWNLLDTPTDQVLLEREAHADERVAVAVVVETELHLKRAVAQMVLEVLLPEIRTSES